MRAVFTQEAAVGVPRVDGQALDVENGSWRDPNQSSSLDCAHAKSHDDGGAAQYAWWPADRKFGTLIRAVFETRQVWRLTPDKDDWKCEPVTIWQSVVLIEARRLPINGLLS